MFNLIKQLHIEGFLSQGKPYLASHPELGVPLGVFNTYDEPNHQSRVNSIKELGKDGNPYSLELAKKYGIKNPLPSFVKLVINGETVEVTDDSFKDAIEDVGYIDSSSIEDYGKGGKGLSAGVDRLNKTMLRLSKERRQNDLNMRETLDIMTVMMSDPTAEGYTGRIQEAYLDILSLTDQFRKDIISDMGMDQGMMTDIIMGITDASDEFTGWALTTNDAMKTLKSTATATGRAFILPEEALVQATKLEKLYNMDMGAVLAEFDKIGIGSKEATDMTNRAVATAGRYGATVSKMLPTVQANISKINTYGFKNGVDGLTDMVAKAQVLGFEMSNVLQTADKAFTPEGAIEMASKLQMIGGAASELLDPFQLMYMAQNDVEGLMDSLTKTAEAAVTFNKETGEFGISPAERLRLKAVADATGTDYTNLADTAVKAAKRTQAIGKLGGIPQLSTADKELIASMSDIDASGEFLVRLGTEDIQFDDLADTLSEHPEMIDKLRAQSEKNEMNLEEVNKAQLTVAEAMAANVAQIQVFLTEMAASGRMGTTAQAMAEAIASSNLGSEMFEGGLPGYNMDLQTVLDGLADATSTSFDLIVGSTPIGDAWKSSKERFGRDNVGPDAPISVPGSGGPLNALPTEIVNYLESTPEGRDLLNQSGVAAAAGFTPSGPKMIEIYHKFSELVISYDGNTLKLTPAQVKAVLPPLFRDISAGIENLQPTTPV
jgi:hypothetical protein